MMKVKAYGKINLTLDVLGRREDGYHLLDTVMQSVSIWDELEIQHSHEPGVHLQCSRESLPVDSKNTAFRAAKFFLEDQGIQGEGVYIFIRKYIPSRSGMGGGSADAAAVLRGLNEMYQKGLSTEKLMEIGARVGADVPFCVLGGAARCTGIGADVAPVSPMPECWLVVCKPPTGMSTPRAYALLDQYPLSSTQATPRMVEALTAGNLRRVAKSVANRFDETIRLAPVRALKRAMMEAGALGAMMTGSGSGVYGIFETEQQARWAMRQLDGKGRTFLIRPCEGI
ncbi:4-(cytidine 5'-diphospho)-2-C-methyl-D-erythritol kinase [Acutalibacter sp. 1XD8-33]|uniref:4-(cytidine 5'-diphospho)-2-C-methyl-D-erythritol kinase n=1 Tax=Acutalibacter sp. 1XD8-33 TaxID=2320081 RepID=UPI000EA1BA69|nr:4-(cytidine 5'-diphospho)-2-C-methyl-D-erythritol kinase [Acutalibacter sp. 1XD8-33]RKJ41369.1 4-(cytidine 5'-diphospho)-2-C-methyl-D-erythritol kinase [Acutalibacter sp. 1XD8-33]